MRYQDGFSLHRIKKLWTKKAFVSWISTAHCLACSRLFGYPEFLCFFFLYALKYLIGLYHPSSSSYQSLERQKWKSDTTRESQFDEGCIYVAWDFCFIIVGVKPIFSPLSRRTNCLDVLLCETSCCDMCCRTLKRAPPASAKAIFSGAPWKGESPPLTLKHLTQLLILLLLYFYCVAVAEWSHFPGLAGPISQRGFRDVFLAPHFFQ